MDFCIFVWDGFCVIVWDGFSIFVNVHWFIVGKMFLPSEIWFNGLNSWMWCFWVYVFSLHFVSLWILICFKWFMIEKVVYNSWVVMGKEQKQKKTKGLVLSIIRWFNCITWVLWCLTLNLLWFYCDVLTLNLFWL